MLVSYSSFNLSIILKSSFNLWSQNRPRPHTQRHKYVEKQILFSYSEDLRQRRLEIKDLLILLFSFIVHASFRVKEILKLERKKKIARNGFLKLFLSDPTNNFFLNLFLSSVIVYISNLFLS